MGGAFMTLRSIADIKEFNIGCSVSGSSLIGDSSLRQILTREFNTITTETDLKFAQIQPNRGVYDFTVADEIINFAIENNLKVRGHTLIWHSSVPAWLENGNLSRAEVIEIMRDHITTVVSRYRNKIFAWDVVNEAFEGSGFRNSYWFSKIGPQYIELAFRYARQADPNALLFYNDFGIEGINSKSNTVYNYFRAYKQYDATLIDGIGIQMHFNVNSQINYSKISQNINRLNTASLQVHFTEIDVALSTNPNRLTDELTLQSNIYSYLFETALRSGGICNTCVVWGGTDKYSWLGSYRKPLIFDYQYNAKPSYYDILQTLVLN